MQLDASIPIDIIDLSEDEIAKIREKYPYLIEVDIPAGTYDGVDHDVHTVGTPQGCQTTTAVSQQDGYNVKNISYSMNHRSRVEAMTAKAGEKVPSSSLYRIAKTVVRYVMDTMKQDDTDL